MKLSFHGAARSVTGSRPLLETSSCRLLLDCGMFEGTGMPGPRQVARQFARWRKELA